MKLKNEDVTIHEIAQLLSLGEFDFHEIKAGFSKDKKYKVSTPSTTLLVRTSDISLSERRKLEFDTIGLAFERGVRCSRTVGFGRIPELGICFSCFEYIPGQDAEAALPSLSKDDAFAIGIEAGRDLRRLNEIRPSFEVASWAERKRKKHRIYAEEYLNSGYSFKGDRELLKCIEGELPAMDGTKNTFQHDDFHVGNIIITGNRYSGVIDFNRMDWGDYVHEFVKLGWFSRMVSPGFARGQLVGYFEGNVPEEFWRKYSLYMAISIYPTIVWHLKNFPHLMDEIRKHLDMILDDHDHFRRHKPKWADMF